MKGVRAKIKRLRSDLEEKLKGIRVLMINGGVFGQASVDGGVENEVIREALLGLKRSGVGVVFLCPEGSQGVRLIAQDLDLIFVECSRNGTRREGYAYAKRVLGVGDGEIAFFALEEDDLPIMESVCFSAVPSTAGLSVKSLAYYVAYGDHRASLLEVIRLLLRAKGVLD